jgi:antitoxin ParD1/3/4
LDMATRNILDALRAPRRRRKGARKLTALRLHIKAGVEALDRGDFAEADDAALDVYLEEC